jgi:hypothetical protein
VSVFGRHCKARLPPSSNNDIEHCVFSSATSDQCALVRPTPCTCSFYVLDLLPLVYRYLPREQPATGLQPAQLCAPISSDVQQQPTDPAEEFLGTLLALTRRNQNPPTHLAVAVDVPGATYRCAHVSCCAAASMQVEVRTCMQHSAVRATANWSPCHHSNHIRVPANHLSNHHVHGYNSCPANPTPLQHAHTKSPAVSRTHYLTCCLALPPGTACTLSTRHTGSRTRQPSQRQ